MTRVLKYELPTTTEFTLPFHEGYRILKLDVVNEKPYLWVLEHEDQPVRNVTFEVVMTGAEQSEKFPAEYVDSFILYHGAFVGHLFMRKEG